ncbi:MAG: SRPBCC family protein [Propionibacteriaceae bacterium]
MDLDHSFTVNAAVDEAWQALTDVARVARCMPGAALDEESSDPYTGTVKIKVGAVAVKFRGEASFVELDESTHSLQLDCRGKDVRGASGASAMIGMVLVEQSAGSTEVRVTTNLQLSGKIAQFGRGMLQDVSNAILQRFVSNLERDLRGGESDPAPGGPEPEPASGSTAVADGGAPSPFGQTQPAAPQSAPTQSAPASRPAPPRAAADDDDDDMIDLGATVLPVLIKRYGTVALSGLAAVLALVALVRSSRGGATGRRPQVEQVRHPYIVVNRWPGEPDAR